MKTLYVIGNGFDIHHKLDTRYQSFALFLEKINNEIYGHLMNYYGLPDLTDPKLPDDEYALWSRFEQALAELDYQLVLDDHSDYAANPGAEDFSDSDWHSYQIEIELIVDKLTSKLISLFNDFILKVDYQGIPGSSLVELEKESHFLNFNYTQTLQQAYQVADNSITYIHNKADAANCTLILGHGTDPKNFEQKKETPPEGLSAQELDHWEEQMSDQYDWSYEQANEQILLYFKEAFKNTAAIIESRSDFFENLTAVKKVIVLGHSLSEVDIRYFEVLQEKLKGNVIWIVSYYSESERLAHRETLLGLGVADSKFVQVKIADLKKRPWLAGQLYYFYHVQLKLYAKRIRIKWNNFR